MSKKRVPEDKSKKQDTKPVKEMLLDSTDQEQNLHPN